MKTSFFSHLSGHLTTAIIYNIDGCSGFCIWIFQGNAGFGFAIIEGHQTQDSTAGIFIRNVTEGGTAFKVDFDELVQKIFAEKLNRPVSVSRQGANHCRKVSKCMVFSKMSHIFKENLRL